MSSRKPTINREDGTDAVLGETKERKRPGDLWRGGTATQATDRRWNGKPMTRFSNGKWGK